jgi:predicted methyltransferase
MIVLSRYQAVPLLAAHAEAKTSATASPDLGRTVAEVSLDPDGAGFPTGVIPWAVVEAVAASETGCFEIDSGDAIPIRAFSDTTKRFYSLYATPSAPTMLVSGIPMHRIKETDPYRDTLEKIKAAGPFSGDVLDTATGLGYTAIEAAKTAVRVTTIELDPAAQEIARRNPWSRDLFDNPRIAQRIGDSFAEIATFPPESFTVILHDPPTLSLGGDLYSGEFYQRAYRVLRRGGRMFHYIGDPNSRTGASTTRGVIRRLREAGFARVVPKPEAFGVTAHK